MKQWVKFYTEALHDRKLRKLSERDQLVFFKLVLLAGQEDQDGYLPNYEDISLELYMDEAEIQSSVSNLMKIGLISENEGGDLYVTKFIQRQETNLSDAERSKKYREKKKNVTTVTQDDTQSRDDRHADACDERSENVTLEKNRKEKNREEIEKKRIEKNREEKNREEKNREEFFDADASHASTKKTKRGVLKPYGIAENVMLSDDEYQKLQEKLGKKGADEQIEALSLYMGQNTKNAKKYTNHYLTVLNWSRVKAEHEDYAKPKQPFTIPKERTFHDIAVERGLVEDIPKNTDFIDSFWRN